MNKVIDILTYELDDIKNGYTQTANSFKCLFCEKEFEKGLIYKHENQYYEASRYIQLHIETAHESVFEALIKMNKKATGLSEHQSELLRCFYNKLQDQQIQQKLKIGSISTVRNHRFAMKEKEKQAKLYLALAALIRDNENAPVKYIQPHETATMVDDRYKITENENAKILKKYFPEELNGCLSTFYIKEKYKLIVLRHISEKFEKNRQYTEKEVNEILKNIFDDYPVLRRYLIEYGFMDRKDDCSAYWMK
jgi:hypothetical protein